jgi:cell division ATPase FtsA
VAGVYPRIMHDGDMDAGVWSCGMVAGLIHDVPTVAQLIAGIMDQAHALINERLGLAPCLSSLTLQNQERAFSMKVLVPSSAWWTTTSRSA